MLIKINNFRKIRLLLRVWDVLLQLEWDQLSVPGINNKLIFKVIIINE